MEDAPDTATPNTAAAILAPPDPIWNPATLPASDPGTAPPPAPAQPAGADPNAPTTPAGMTLSTLPIPSEQAPNNPDLERQGHEGFLHRILDKVGSILGGDDTIHVTRDKDGNLTVTHAHSTTGEKWGRIAAAALGGAAKGAAASQGPGGIAKAASAGTEWGMQLPKQIQDDANAQVTADQKRQEMAAQNVLLHQRAYQTMLESQGLKMDIDTKTRDLLNESADDMRSSPDAKDFGVIKSFDDLNRINDQNTDFLHAHTHLILKAALLPSKSGGFELHAIATDPGDDARPVDSGDKIHQLMVDPKTGFPRMDYEAPAKGSRTKKGALRLANQSTDVQYAQLMTAWSKANPNKEPKSPTEADFAYTATHDPDPNERAKARQSLNLMKEKAGTGTEELSGFDPQATLETNAEMMVDGLASPSLMSKRSKDYNQLYPLAQAYSLKKYGQPFDAEISEARYQARKETLQQFAGGKPADQIQSFQTFTNHAQNLMDDVANARITNVKLVNTAYNKIRNMSGSAAVTALQTHVDALRREYLNFLSNNMALKGDEIKESKEIMSDDSTPAQIEQGTKAFMETAIGRVSALNNRALRFNVPIGGEILTPQNRQTINNMGLGDYANRMIKPQPQGPAMFGGQPQGQPQPAPAPTPQVPAQKVGDAGKGTSAPPTDGGGQTWNAQTWRDTHPGQDVGPSVQWAKAHNFKVINE